MWISSLIKKKYLKSDGNIDKLKVRIAIRGDLDDSPDDDNSAPLATFRVLKMYLAEAARRRRRVQQADYVGAYLQAYMKRRVFVRLPAEWAEHFPEFAEWLGVPLLLRKSAYGIDEAGRLWAETLFAWFVEFGFVQSVVEPSLFYYRQGDEWINLLSYSDDTLFTCSSDTIRLAFEKAMCTRFDCKLMGQAHWFLQARITQHASFDITLDQSRYAAAMSLRFLPLFDNVNISAKDKLKYAAPLPSDIIFTKADCSTDYFEVKKLQEELGFEYPVGGGCLLWLLNTYPKLQFAVRKLVKFSRMPGKNHFRAMLHTFHHIRCFHLVGLTFYSDVMDAPVSRLLFENDIPPNHPLIAYSDSSWQDCPDTGRSTGGYVLFMQGGVVDAASCLPDPVALSSAEAEYNTCCVAGTAANACAMLIQEMLGNDPDKPLGVPLLLDNKAAISMGNSFRDTKHNRHVLRRYHYTRWMVENGRVILIWIPGQVQLADPCTKNLSAVAPTYIVFLAMVETQVQL